MFPISSIFFMFVSLPAFSVLFVPLVLVNFSFLFSLFFLYSFPPTVFFISYIIYIRAVFCLSFYISPFIPSFSPISFSVYFPSFFSCIALFLFSLRFRISVSAIFTSCFLTLFLRCSLSLRIQLCS